MRSPKEIGITVRKLRGDLSLRDFAKKCDIAHTTLDNIEKGFDPRTKKPANPSARILERIAIAAGVSVEYILRGEYLDDFSEKSTSSIKQQKFADEGELSEDVIIYHRDGKTVKKQFTKEHMDVLLTMIDAFPEKPKNI